MAVKAGMIALTRRRQVEKDIHITEGKLAGVKSLERYYDPGKTGLGPSRGLEKATALRDNNIKIYLHGM